MTRSKLIFLTIISGLSFYFYNRVDVSVSGAEASEEVTVKEEEEDGFWAEEEVTQETKEQAPQSETFAEEKKIDHHLKMVYLIQTDQLCSFLEYVKRHSLSQKQQYQALSESYGTSEIKELDAFFETDMKVFDQYQSLTVKTYLIGKKLHAFSRHSRSGSKDFNAGIEKEDKELLEKIEKLSSQDGGNVLYSMLKIRLLEKYTNKTDDFLGPLFSEMISADRYSNPVHKLVQKLYERSKNNTTQFHLATKILSQPLTLENSFAISSIWHFGTLDMREHMSSLFYDSFKDTRVSTQAYGYEPGIYKAYRSSLPYEDYKNTPNQGEYEESLQKPTYKLADLKIDPGENCQQSATELAIKLRSI